MEVSVGEDPVNSATDGAQLGHGALLDADPAGEVFVAVEEAGGPVQRVSGVVDSRALLGGLVGSAEEDPLLGSRHLTAGIRLAVSLQLHGQTVELHAELSEVFVLPDSLVLSLRGAQNVINICNTQSVKSAVYLSAR